MPEDPEVATAWERLGGQDAVVRLVGRFYAAMDTLPEAATLRAMHDDDLGPDQHKLAAFLSGWLGGPALYWHSTGDDEVRARHAHLPVDAAAAAAWLRCMDVALHEVVADRTLRDELRGRFAHVAARVRNRP